MSKPNLKIAKLRDNTPTKMSINITPDLKSELDAYAAVYQKTYGDSQNVSSLIPLMLEGFLASDSAFKKAKRELASAS